MEQLPDELLELICSYLNCKQIILFSRICKHFNKLNIKSILNKRKVQEFPRNEGKAFIHNIPNNIVFDKHVIINYLYDYINIIKGDLVKIDYNVEKSLTFDDEIMIFDGLDLKKLNINRYFDYILPEEFHVIENDVPINYWNDVVDKYDRRFHKRHFNDQHIWFNYSLIKNQENIKYRSMNKFGVKNGDDGLFGIYTKFRYNNIKYYIILDYYYYSTVSYSRNQVNMDTFEIYDEIIKSELIDIFAYELNSDEIKFCNALSFDMIENNNNLLFVGYF